MNPIRGLRDAQGGGGSGGQPADCGEQIKAMWEKVPYFCKFIFITTTALYLSSFISTILVGLLYVSPIKVIYGFQIWRLITGPFVHIQLLQLLFSLMSYVPTAMQQEKLEGTVKQTFRFFTTAILIEILFVLVCFILSLTVSSYFITVPSVGLWPILFCDIVVECNKSPDLARPLCCLPIQIKSKYYPIVLIVLFTVFFGLQVDLFIGFGVGYLHIYGLLKVFEVSTQKAKTWETKFPFKHFRQSPSFVAADGAAGGSSLPTFVRTNAPQQSASSGQRAQPQAQPQQFSAFAGKGTKLGVGPLSTLSSTSTSSSTSQQQQQQKANTNIAGKSVLVDGSGKFKKPDEIDDDISTTRDEGEGHDMHKTQDGQSDYQKVIQDTSYSI